MLRFWKMTSAILKIGKLSVNLATSNFQELFENKLLLEVKLVLKKAFF